MSKKKRPRQSGQQKQPHWQPISMLPTLATHIDGMLEVDEEQYHHLLQARPKPHVLDDFTVNRVIQVFTKQQKDLPLFDEQLKRWQALTLTLTTEQRAEVERLVKQMARLHEVHDQVLALARELSQGTIEKVMSKSDAELGMEYLLRMMGGKGMP